jgi:BlaI family penicillinase repressor
MIVLQNLSLSDGEWKLMNLLWEHAPRTIAQLVAELKDDTGWTKGTVFMMLSRMQNKGAVRFEAPGRSKLYYPILKQEDAVSHETENFLSKVYGGSVGLMVASMAGQKALKKEEIDELYDILHKAEKEAGK